jgi:hypothetical protein
MGRYGRYLAGWAVVGALLYFALTEVVPGVAGAGGRPCAATGVVVAAATDLVVFALLLRALASDARGFPKLWGLSVAVKVVFYVSAIVLVWACEWFPLDGFVQVLIVSFVVFSHHEVFQLVVSRKKPDRIAAAAASAGS